MRYHNILTPSLCALVTALCALAAPASAQDGPRGPRNRESDRQRDNDFRPPPRMRREFGPDRFEGSRSGDRGFERDRGGRARDDGDRPSRRGPGDEARRSNRGPRPDRDDAWAELATRMRRPDEARGRQPGMRGPRGGFGPSGFAGGISGGPRGGARGGGFGSPPAQRTGSNAIASELREMNNKLDRLTSALERISQR